MSVGSQFANNIIQRWSRVNNHEHHAQFTTPPPLNDIVGEFKNERDFEVPSVRFQAHYREFANNISMWLYQSVLAAVFIWQCSKVIWRYMLTVDFVLREKR
jgi:hypothetical protein